MPDLTLHPPPGFVEMPAVCAPCPDGRCSICADEGTPGRILQLLPDNMAAVQLPAGPEQVALDLVDGAQAGDWVLVHLGFAITRLEMEA